MFKTKLQELCHRKSYKLPEYSIVKQGQDHDPRFEATVTVDGKQFSSQAPSKSSKQAQNYAAKLAFDFFSLPSSSSCLQTQTQTQSPTQPEQCCSQPFFPVSSLPQEQLHCIPPFLHPALHISSFPQPSLPPQLGTFAAITNLENEVFSPHSSEVKLEVTNESSELEESTKDSSLMSNMDIKFAAQSGLPKIQNTDKSPVVEDIDKECTKLTGLQHLYKNQLQNFAQKRSLTLPVYTCERDGPPHASRFRCKVEIGGKTYGSPDFHATLKDAENAVAKVALMSCQDGAQEDSGLYKNLLQEMAQKRGLGLPAYSTSQSGEVHVPFFVSLVKIGEETFEGERLRTKKQAEMSAAKVAYITLKEGQSSKSPLIASPRGRASQVFSASLQPNVSTDPELQVSSCPAISHPSMAIEKQPNAGESQSISTRKRAPSSCDLDYEVSRDIATSSHNVAEAGESKDYILNIVSKLEAGKSSSSKRVFVCPRQPDMKFPEDSTILPISDDQWVAFSLPTEASQ